MLLLKESSKYWNIPFQNIATAKFAKLTINVLVANSKFPEVQKLKSLQLLRRQKMMRPKVNFSWKLFPMLVFDTEKSQNFVFFSSLVGLVFGKLDKKRQRVYLKYYAQALICRLNVALNHPSFCIFSQLASSQLDWSGFW